MMREDDSLLVHEVGKGGDGWSLRGRRDGKFYGHIHGMVANAVVKHCRMIITAEDDGRGVVPYGIDWAWELYR